MIDTKKAREMRAKGTEGEWGYLCKIDRQPPYFAQHFELLQGEGRVTRREKKRRTRERRSVRWNLVHAAGCVVSGCASRDPWLIAQYVAEARALGVSVPRSLRPKPT